MIYETVEVFPGFSWFPGVVDLTSETDRDLHWIRADISLFSLYFPTIFSVLFLHCTITPLPHIPSCAVQCSAIAISISPVTFVREIFYLMTAPHFYPDILNLFAMCGHNQSISFERSLSYSDTSPETVIQYEGNFTLFISRQTCKEERGAGGSSFFSSLTQLTHSFSIIFLWDLCSFEKRKTWALEKNLWC